MCLAPLTKVFSLLVLTGSQNIAIYYSICVHLPLSKQNVSGLLFSILVHSNLNIPPHKKRRLLKYFMVLKLIFLSPQRSTGGAASEWLTEIQIHDGPTNVSVALVIDCSEPVLNLF